MIDKAHPFCLAKQSWVIDELTLANAFAFAVGKLHSEMAFNGSTYVMSAASDVTKMINAKFIKLPISSKPFS